MTNMEIIREFINGERADKGNACNHIIYKGDELYNYSTLLATVDRERKVAALNVRKYSRTTGKIQGMIRRELVESGYKIKEVEGADFIPWNYGYMGAKNWKVSDVKKFSKTLDILQ